MQAIAAKNDTSEDKTGGNLTLQAFYTLDAAKINDYGYYKVVKGKHLSYKTQSDGVLISQALADKNNLKVGDKVTVGNPSKASDTYTFTVRGIYEYDSDVPEGNGSDAKYAKDNRENVIYTTYINFAKNGLDTTEARMGHSESEYHLLAGESFHLQHVRALGEEGQVGHEDVRDHLAVAYRLQEVDRAA